MKLTMNYDLARAAATDAVNARVRAEGRTQWTREDMDLFATEMERIYPVAKELEDRYGR